MRRVIRAAPALLTERLEYTQRPLVAFVPGERAARGLEHPSRPDRCLGARAWSSFRDSDLITREAGSTFVEAYTDTGFILRSSGGSKTGGLVAGPIFCAHGLALSLLCRGLHDFPVQSLAVLDLIKPVPDTAVIGTGRHLQQVPDPVLRALRERGIGAEAADTASAIGLYNTLLSDGRAVAAFLFPTSSTQPQ
ncbi:unnamed protein product [Pedinophyceae sp. YPF-701]|nr:unnamed protein product [Pedinophyceae sp. YPF-701]